jgi:hypothetical protein
MSPKYIAEALQEARRVKVEAQHHDCLTVLFSDVVKLERYHHRLVTSNAQDC